MLENSRLKGSRWARFVRKSSSKYLLTVSLLSEYNKLLLIRTATSPAALYILFYKDGVYLKDSILYSKLCFLHQTKGGVQYNSTCILILYKYI